MPRLCSLVFGIRYLWLVRFVADMARSRDAQWLGRRSLRSSCLIDDLAISGVGQLGGNIEQHIERFHVALAIPPEDELVEVAVKMSFRTP
jgi:hypothetical protein